MTRATFDVGTFNEPNATIVVPGQVVDSLDDVRDLCAEIAACVDMIDGRAPLTPEDRIAAWHHFHAAVDAAKVVLGQLAADAVEAMAQLELSEVETDVGPVHVEKGSKRTEWRGHALIAALGEPLVDRASGEVVVAIPVHVAQQVISGCNEPDKTSASFLVGGLEQQGIRVADYRTVHDAPLVIKPGPLPAQLRRSRRRRPSTVDDR